MIEWNEKRKIMFWLEETGVYVKKLNINDLFFVSFLFFGGVKEVNINIYF